LVTHSLANSKIIKKLKALIFPIMGFQDSAEERRLKSNNGFSLHATLELLTIQPEKVSMSKSVEIVRLPAPTRVARFLLTHYTKTGKIYQITTK
jgi:hypothetical protein